MVLGSWIRNSDRNLHISSLSHLGECLLALDHFAVNLVEVDLADLVHHILVVEGDESEAPVSVGHLVVSQHRLLYLGKLLKVGLQKIDE